MCLIFQEKISRGIVPFVCMELIVDEGKLDVSSTFDGILSVPIDSKFSFACDRIRVTSGDMISDETGGESSFGLVQMELSLVLLSDGI